MSTSKVYVIGKDINEIHRHTTAAGVPWHLVAPVTDSNQLRVAVTGPVAVMVNWVPDTAMHPALKSVVRTQLSIRRCLGLLAGELTTSQMVTRSPSWTVWPEMHSLTGKVARS
jgi:hypothetical protein